MAIPAIWATRVFYALIFLSGCSGLIYQVVWHKYLAILLGAQARATAVVLAIFLGGISVGYAAFGRWTRYKRWNLFTAYSCVEIGLGLWAFIFPHLFRIAMPVTASLYASLGVTNLLIDIFMSVLLIGFPTFLMGGTLPLLTQGLSKDVDDASRVHARIYGWNTLGACLGCLFAGYILIPLTSLPAACTVGGLLNVFVGVTTYIMFARGGSVQHVKAKAPPLRMSFRGFTPKQLAILAIGFLSGFYLITLETVLIRLMGLSTGSSNYNFTLIVAIFILGLGIGALVVRNITHFDVSRLFWNQVGVAVTLFLLYLTCDYWSYYVHLIRVMLRDLPQAFYLYQALLGVAFTILLIVPIGLAGFTLPLCFHFIKDEKESLGERVGQLYGVNTVGCVLGALIGGYCLLNFIDLDQLFKVCVFLSLLTVVASAYLYVPAMSPSGMSMSVSSGLMALVLMGLLVTGGWTKARFLQPFRHAQPTEATFKGADAFGKWLSRTTEFIYWKDGPNTSIGIGATKFDGREVSRTIVVNGKSDGNTRGDFFTTTMLGHIPALLGKKTDRVCVIGLGTGITIGTLIQYPEVRTVDVAEISNFSIANASYFDAYDNHVSESGKVTFHEMDAFRFLEGTKENFDIIVSEPSNPWVAGIENLYSEEFYKIARDKMSPDGMFVQWIHTYSFNDDLLRMVLKTITGNFEWVSVFKLYGGDLALVAKRKPFTREDIARAEERIRTSPLVRQSLNEAGIQRIETVLALEVIPNPIPKVMGEGMRAHRLESPRLSDEAAKAFFVGSTTRVQSLRREYKEFYGALDSSLLALWLGADNMPSWSVLQGFKSSFCDNNVSKTGFLCEETLAMMKLEKPDFQSDAKYDDVVTNRDLASLDVFHKELPKRFTADDLQTIYSMFELYKKFASPIARVPISSFMRQVDYCMRDTVYKDELYGECLLQKILVLETVAPASPEFKASVNQYLDWFPNLSRTASNYQKLEEARNILVKLVAQKD